MAKRPLCVVSIFLLIWKFNGVESHRFTSPYSYNPQTRYRNNIEIVEGTIDQLSNIDPKWICRNTKTGDQIVFGTEILDQYIPNSNQQRETTSQFNNGQQGSGYNPGQQVPGYNPGQQIPGYNSGQQVPGYNSGQQIPGYNSGQQVPGYNSGQQIPGYNPGQQIPGYNSGQQIPGYNPGQQIPGYNPGQQVAGYNPGQQVHGYNSENEGSNYNSGNRGPDNDPGQHNVAPGTNSAIRVPTSPSYKTIEELMNAYPHLDWSNYATVQSVPTPTTLDPREVSGELHLQPRFG